MRKSAARAVAIRHDLPELPLGIGSDDPLAALVGMVPG